MVLNLEKIDFFQFETPASTSKLFKRIGQLNNVLIYC